MYDEHMFSHLVDEALAFEKELRNNYSYPANQPGCLHVLAQDAPFEKWIQIERKCKLTKINCEFLMNIFFKIHVGGHLLFLNLTRECLDTVKIDPKRSVCLAIELKL